MAECNCGAMKTISLLFACSGMANTGLLSDRVMRALAKEKVGNGTCLAAIGAGLSGYLESARSATRNIVLDGCPVACGAKIFQRQGINFEHHIMTEYGPEKGKTPITEELVEEITTRVKSKLQS